MCWPPSACVERTSAYAWLEIDEVRVKGRSAATKLFTLFGRRGGRRLAGLRGLGGAARRHAGGEPRGPLARGADRALALAGAADPQWRPLYDNLAARYAEGRRAASEPVLPMGLAHVHDA